ncbi:hypothetical protein BV22DRAFT_1025803 [Leucogyrophana mollusca]|uniref:Uncharacterized protein n=1 Tax=Leucogyrophana mollusca TaxID=85980 RepID=A0ACB8AYT2_9AGAM|nr:hypothetical protein BV22DRAFT_1025803 [Leucogyrophana mollusca]
MGCSPYLAVMGAHPILPLDICEATYLQPPPDNIITSMDLIARRAITLQTQRAQMEITHSKAYQARMQAGKRFDLEHSATMSHQVFDPGDLVLVWHTVIEKSLNRKMRPRYLKPVIVLSRNRGGAYILAELDGSVFDRPAAAFQVVPYLTQRLLAIPDLADFIDISLERFRKLKESEEEDPEEEKRALPSYCRSSGRRAHRQRRRQRRQTSVC